MKSTRTNKSKKNRLTRMNLTDPRSVFLAQGTNSPERLTGAEKYAEKYRKRKMAKYVGSVEHRLYPSSKHMFELGKGKDTIPVGVTIVETDTGGSASSMTKKDGKYELVLPVRKGVASMLAEPVAFVNNGRKYLLSAKAGSKKSLIGSRRVLLSLYTADEE